MANKMLVKRVVGGKEYELLTQSSADIVNIERTDLLPESASNVQDVINSLKKQAFSDGENLVYISSTEAGGDENQPLTEVDDSKVSYSSTWSSAKLKKIFELLGVKFDDEFNPSV